MRQTEIRFYFVIIPIILIKHHETNWMLSSTLGMLLLNSLKIIFILCSFAPITDGLCIDENRCEYKCNCETNCTNNDGLCRPPAKCKKGWFGLRCQYQDLMNVENVTVAISPPQPMHHLADDNDATYATSVKYVTVSWNTPYPLTWTRLIFRNLSQVKNVTLFYERYKEQNLVPCKLQRAYMVNNRTLDIKCLDNVTTASIKIEGTLSEMCSVFISGGRNLAYRQEAKLSSTYEVYGGDRAVDGNTKSDFSFGSCAHSNLVETSPTLTVTLQQPVVIHRVVLYNRDMLQYRLRSFQLELFNITGQTVFAFKDTSNVDRSVYQVIVSSDNVKSIVVTATQKDEQYTILAVCELEAYGECPAGKWGLSCVNVCPEQCKSYCHVDDGSCNVICFGSSDPPKCLTKYAKGEWGINCQENCSSNCFDSSCDGQTGQCDNGCSGYSDPPVCKTTCSKGHYGTNCTSYCSHFCVNQTCDRSTGHCLECLPGFKGNFCDLYNSPEGQCEPSFAHGLAVGAAAVVLIAVVFVLVYRRQNKKIQELISQHKDNVYNKHNVPHEEFSLCEGLNPDIKMKENLNPIKDYRKHKLNNLDFNRFQTAVSVMLYISFLIFYFVSGNSAALIDESCTDKTKCEYQCHCDGRCHDNSGLCQSPGKCSKGWFGLRCQYKDLMILGRAILPGLPRHKLHQLIDNNDATCLTSVMSVTVIWKDEYHLTWTRLVFKNITTDLMVVMLYTTQGAKTHFPCKHQRLYIVDTRTLDMRCLDNVTTSSVKIKWTSTDLCSIYISGGRNFAYRQEANMSTTYELGYDGDKAVDGNIDSSFDSGSCAHSAMDEDLPKLTVTLQQPALIHRVVLYNRDVLLNRLRSFYVEIFNSTQQKTFEYEDRSTVGQAVYEFNVNSRIAKQVVVSVKHKSPYQDDKKPVLTICELEVYGECPPGKWGLTCSNDCPEHCSNYCHIDDGSCNVSCVGSNDPAECATECVKGKWGLNCQQNCSKNCFNISCDRHTGQCDDGCMGFSDPPVCNKSCISIFFGRNCSEQCPVNCLNKTCHPASGHCYLCIDGYVCSDRFSWLNRLPVAFVGVQLGQ
ncbi:hypothetical protein Btru_026747 [Bulinus truncatus]|nr:hypothetical protein Btru_026747 [Bulinus truncatus]